MAKKDPRRWDKVIIKSPYGSLTKRDVFDYYQRPEVKRRILQAVRSTGTNETIIRQNFSPEQVVLRRKDSHGNFINLRKAKDFDNWTEVRMSEIHPVFGKKTNLLLADIDPGEKVPWRKTKSITETIAKIMSDSEDVKNVQVQFSGDRGFYVKGILGKKIDVDQARKKVKNLLKSIAQRPDVTLAKAKVDQIRIDTTPLKFRGSVKAPYSLSSRTGLVAAPVKLEDLPKVRHSDFRINKVKVSSLLSDVRNPALRSELERALATYDNTDKAHGRRHVENVIRAANKLNERFKLPRDRVIAAAVLHDIGLSYGREQHAEVGEELAQQYLKSLPPQSRSAVGHAIREHRYSSGNPRSTLARVINDADTLSDFMEENDPDYLFRRLVEFRKNKGMPSEEVYEDARNYIRPWIRKALQGGLRTEEALEEFRPKLEEAYRRTADAGRFRKFLQPMVEREYKTASKKEFAPGIPISRKIDPIPTIKNKAWKLSIQKHKAHVAGKHYDLRLIDPSTGKAHSFAIPKARLPSTKKILLAIQQPTHTADYALNFQGKIPEGTYGAGEVTWAKKPRDVKILKASPDKLVFEEGKNRFALFRMKGNNWGFKKMQE